ncbi:uncharacterized protein Dana_GF27398, partial [Drosophila ananassae]
IGELTREAGRKESARDALRALRTAEVITHNTKHSRDTSTPYFCTLFRL